MADGHHAEPANEGGYSLRQVARVLAVPEHRLRYWSQTGFIVPSAGAGRYSFRDLIAVKVARALIDGGVPLRRVRRSLLALAKHLPGIDTSLAGLRIRCDNERVLVDERDHSFEAASGQLVLDFEVDALRRELADVVALPVADEGDRGGDGPRDAYEYFLLGCELEHDWDGAPADVEGFAAARAAYEEALRRDPSLSAAWTNLGALVAHGGDLEGARACFERALQDDPEQPEALCNLAELALREGDAEGAVEAYRHVLRASPDWLEAHYGLARALLAVGGRVQALAHLERFCAAVDRLPRVAPELAHRRESALSVIAELREQGC
jgi:tetratricopeptide (TPR) repeat protein